MRKRKRKTGHHLDARVDHLINSSTIAVGPDDELLSAAQLGTWLGIAPSTLSIWRHRGKGPPWVALGKRRLRYRRRDVFAWLETRTRTETAA